MKIAINSPEPPYTRGYEIFLNGTLKRLSKSRGGMFPNDFNEDEIYYLLGEKDYNKFENGKYEFDIPKWKLDAISGDGISKNREQLIYRSNWNDRKF